ANRAVEGAGAAPDRGGRVALGLVRVAVTAPGASLPCPLFRQTAGWTAAAADAGAGAASCSPSRRSVRARGRKGTAKRTRAVVPALRRISMGKETPPWEKRREPRTSESALVRFQTLIMTE